MPLCMIEILGMVDVMVLQRHQRNFLCLLVSRNRDELEQPIHKRYLWEKIKKWEKVEINP